MKRIITTVTSAVFILASANMSAQLVSPTAAMPPVSKKLERSVAKNNVDLNFDASLAPFYHGVASGDPLPNRVMLWTRRTPNDDAASYQLGWQVAADADFNTIVRQGLVSANINADFTAKVDVGQLVPGTTYYYRFYDFALQSVSITGRTRTAPTGNVDHLRFAVVSCNNYQAGYYNAFRKISERADLDAVVHLGDYIYEYGAGEGTYGYSPDRPDRLNVPEVEILTLADYRTRYSLYRLDADLRAAHQQHPFITVWDDHESANDSHANGAENHNENEGDWEARKAISRQVYYEWMPIRETPNEKLYRTLKYGDIAELFMLDTRLEAREEQPLLASDTIEYRTMLGQTQLNWLRNKMAQSTAKWKIVGNQVIFAPFNVGFAATNPTDLQEVTLLESIFVDIWDGYPKERKAILSELRSNPQIGNVVILTGDFHCAFAFDVPIDPVIYPNPFALNFPTPSPSYNPVTGEGSLAVEFATPSISSANFDENTDPSSAQGIQFAINADIPIGPPLGTVNYNPHLKYVDLIQHGYMILNVTEAAVQADWYFVNILEPNDDTQSYGAGQLSVDGSRHLSPAQSEAPGKSEQPVLAPLVQSVNTNGFDALVSHSNESKVVAFNIFPIPAKAGSELYIHLGVQENTMLVIEMIDISGRVMSTNREGDKAPGMYTYTLPIAESTPAGVYFVRISTSNEVLTRKLVVE